MINIIILLQAIATFTTTLLLFDFIKLSKFKLTLNNLPIILIMYVLYIGALLFSVYSLFNYLLIGAFLTILLIMLLFFAKQPIKWGWFSFFTVFWAQMAFVLIFILLFSKLEDLDNVYRP